MRMYVFMDIEATGQVQSEAFQVAMVITNQQFEVKEILNFYVEHDEPISPYVVNLCHLETEDLRIIEEASYSRSAAVELVERTFEKYEEDGIIIVGKMIKGDIKWLRKIGVKCNRLDFMEDSRYIELNHFFEGNHKLEEDCLEYGITKETLVNEVKQFLKEGMLTYGVAKLLGGGYHNALVDAYAVYRILKKMTQEKEIDLDENIQSYDWTNRSYLMMNRKAMEDKIAVEIYRQHLIREIKAEYGIDVSYKRLRAIDTIMFDNGCMMGVTKKEVLLNAYLPELKRSRRPYFNHYVVRIRRGKYIKRLNIVALNRFDLFIQLSKIISPQHIPKSFDKRSVIIGLLERPCAYLEANGYTLLSVKLKETHIGYKEIS